MIFTAGREQLRYQATHDLLTGLSNRRAVRDSLSVELARASRDRTPLGVVMVDVDHFKNVNDTYGHQAGDIVLTIVADRMRSQMRPYDLSGRYGGEEFLIVLPGCDLENTFSKADALCQFISASPIETPGGRIAVTASMGAAVLMDLDDPDLDDLIHQADLALYRAKRNGRNRVEMATAADEPCSDSTQELCTSTSVR